MTRRCILLLGPLGVLLLLLQVSILLLVWKPNTELQMLPSSCFHAPVHLQAGLHAGWYPDISYIELFTKLFNVEALSRKHFSPKARDNKCLWKAVGYYLGRQYEVTLMEVLWHDILVPSTWGITLLGALNFIFNMSRLRFLKKEVAERRKPWLLECSDFQVLPYPISAENARGFKDKR